MNVLTIDQIPLIDLNLNAEIDISPPEVKCNQCQVEILDKCYEYSQFDAEYRYLCEECHQIGYDICHYDLNFYLSDQLIAINDIIKINISQSDIIKTYMQIQGKIDYLESIGVDSHGVKIQQFTVTSFQDHQT